MFNLFMISALVQYSQEKYPMPNKKMCKKEVRRLLYSNDIINELIDECIRQLDAGVIETFDKGMYLYSPIDIFESYEVTYEYLNTVCKSDVYAIQLIVIKDVLQFLRNTYE